VKCAAERASGREYAKHGGAGQHLGTLARFAGPAEEARAMTGEEVKISDRYVPSWHPPHLAPGGNLFIEGKTDLIWAPRLQ
jgi:hypothetical protein